MSKRRPRVSPFISGSVCMPFKGLLTSSVCLTEPSNLASSCSPVASADWYWIPVYVLRTARLVTDLVNQVVPCWCSQLFSRNIWSSSYTCRRLKAAFLYFLFNKISNILCMNRNLCNHFPRLSTLYAIPWQSDQRAVAWRSGLCVGCILHQFIAAIAIVKMPSC